MRTSLNHVYHLNPLIILIALLIINLGMHAPFLIKDYFGEPDAARKANSSILASYDGDFHNTEYPLHSSPLYMDILRYCLKANMISIDKIPFWMAIVSLISSAAVTAALFIFVSRLTDSVLVASSASLILQLIPAFWFNSSYGFPTIVALALLMLSLILLQGAFGKSPSRYKYLQGFGALILYILAVMTKVDILLASAIYCLPLWRSDRSFKTKIIWTGIFALFSFLVFLLFNQYAKILEAKPVGTHFTYSAWNSEWPMSLGNLVSKGNIVIILRAAGILSLPVALLGLVSAGGYRKWRSTIFWLVMSGLPLALFWGIRTSNSARNFLISVVPLCIILALPLVMDKWRKWAWVSLLIVMCLTNYFYFPADNDIRSTSGRLLPSTYLFRESVKKFHLSAQTIANLPYEKVALIGDGGDMSPFFRFELLRSGRIYQREGDRMSPDYKFNLYRFNRVQSTEQTSNMEIPQKNQKQIFLWIYRELAFRVSDISKRKNPDFIELVRNGYFLVACDRDSSDLLEHIIGIKGKWVSLEQLLPAERNT